jgi:hypothetical protein
MWLLEHLRFIAQSPFFEYLIDKNISTDIEQTFGSGSRITTRDINFAQESDFQNNKHYKN